MLRTYIVKGHQHEKIQIPEGHPDYCSESCRCTESGNIGARYRSDIPDARNDPAMTLALLEKMPEAKNCRCGHSFQAHSGHTYQEGADAPDHCGNCLCRSFVAAEAKK